VCVCECVCDMLWIVYVICIIYTYMWDRGRVLRPLRPLPYHISSHIIYHDTVCDISEYHNIIIVRIYILWHHHCHIIYHHILYITILYMKTAISYIITYAMLYISTDTYHISYIIYHENVSSLPYHIYYILYIKTATLYYHISYIWYIIAALITAISYITYHISYIITYIIHIIHHLCHIIYYISYHMSYTTILYIITAILHIIVALHVFGPYHIWFIDIRETWLMYRGTPLKRS
jgi:hypothetical protein